VIIFGSVWFLYKKSNQTEIFFGQKVVQTVGLVFLVWVDIGLVFF
jgi:hypothetical protein